MMGKERPSTYFHSRFDIFLTWNTTSAAGHESTRMCCANDRHTAPISHTLFHGGRERRLLLSVIALRALNISMVTRTERATVPGFLSLNTSRSNPLEKVVALSRAWFLRSCANVMRGPCGFLHIHQMYPHTVAIPTYAPVTRYLVSIQPSTSCSARERGGRCMMPGSAGLKERAVAGRPSVTRFTQRRATGERTSGRPRMTARKTHTTSPMLDEMR
mmetsp:Transcript_25300/g.51483  ORF Transcript_25300/g.51483 Transcript_25300/m.51483 type:complete len:216 (+) Transcript_25300:3-650(+)